MSNLQFITLMLIASIALTVFVIVKTKRTPFHPDTKVLIYVLAVFSPLIGLILYLFKAHQLKKG